MTAPTGATRPAARPAPPAASSAPGTSRRVLAAAVVVAVAGALGAAAVGRPLLVLGLGAVLVGLLIADRPPLATLLAVALLYSNAVVVVTTQHGVPGIAAGVIPLLLAVTVAHRTIVRGQPLVLPVATPWVVALLLVQVVGALASRDPETSLATVATFATEGLALFLLVAVAAEGARMLRQAALVLVVLATLLSALSLVQMLTGTEDDDHLGFAQVSQAVVGRDDVTGQGEARHAGPIGEQNRWAQTLAVVLPLAIALAATDRTVGGRLVGAVGIVGIATGIVLTYSRGAAVGLLLAGLVAVALRWVPRRAALVVAALAVVGLVGFAPLYVSRTSTVVTAGGSTGDPAAELDPMAAPGPDGSFTNRATEAKAALAVFAQHPVVGVGPGLFPSYFQDEARRQGAGAHRGGRPRGPQPLPRAGRRVGRPRPGGLRRRGGQHPRPPGRHPPGPPGPTPGRGRPGDRLRPRRGRLPDHRAVPAPRLRPLLLAARRPGGRHGVGARPGRTGSRTGSPRREGTAMSVLSTPRPPRRRRVVLAALLACLLVPVGHGPVSAAALDAGAAAGAAADPALAAEPGDIGWEGPSFTGDSGSPSGSKPESKVWFNDGRWWADLWDAAAGDHVIHWLDTAAETWVPTATTLDTRTSARADVLWDGSKLYVATHRFAEGSSTTATGQPALLRRLSYSHATHTYTLDPGFPVVINDARTETLVIDKDSTGRLWATWTQDKQVMVSVSSVGGQTWGTPFVVPTGGTTVSSDDISSLIAYSPDQIGVMWSNQDRDTMYFAHRTDSDPAGTWSAPEVAYTGPSAADDHINLASVADQDGRILAAVKTSLSGSNPLVHLLDRNPLTGAWTSHTFGTGSDGHTRPVVAVDRQAGVAHMFATSGQSGGSIYEKTAPLGALTFPTGKGTPVLTDASSSDINNATTTKQSVDSTTGLVVLASNDSTRQYWTHFDPLGGGSPPPPPPPGAPVASFTASPVSGTAPLDVAFADTSSGSVSSRVWDFGDGSASSSAASVTHRYAGAGSFTARLTVTGPGGTSSATRTIAVSAAPPPPPPGTSVTFGAEADAVVKSTSATRNYGTESYLRTRTGSPEYVSYVRFAVAGLSGAPQSARLRLWVTDASRDGGVVSRTGSSWGEGTITWANAPAVGAPLGQISASASSGSWVEVDVTAAVTGNGAVSLALSGLSSDSGLFASREAGPAPQLVVETGGSPPPPPPPGAPVASFTASPVSGTAPLDVAFADTSSGSVSSRVWDFGDGSASSSAASVTHRYAGAGSFTARLTVTGPGGTSSATRTIAVSAAPPPPPPGTSVTFGAEADAVVKSTSATRNYGTESYLRTRTGSPEYVSYVRFAVAGLSGAPQSARLRLWVTDASRDGGVVSRTGSSWGEGTITWANAPAVGAPLGQISASASSGSWVEVDVTAAVTGNGAVSLALSGLSSDSGLFASREAGPAPQLVVVP